MTLHQDIIRARLDGATNLQDAYRIAWMAGIPAEHRKATSNWPHLHRGTETLKSRAAIQFQAMTDRIMPLHEEGQTVLQIRAATGYSESGIRKVLRSQGKTPNTSVRYGPHDLSHLFEQAAELRRRGYTWDQVGPALGVGRERMRAQYVAKFGKNA